MKTRSVKQIVLSSTMCAGMMLTSCGKEEVGEPIKKEESTTIESIKEGGGRVNRHRSAQTGGHLPCNVKGHDLKNTKEQNNENKYLSNMDRDALRTSAIITPGIFSFLPGYVYGRNNPEKTISKWHWAVAGATMTLGTAGIVFYSALKTVGGLLYTTHVNQWYYDTDAPYTITSTKLHYVSHVCMTIILASSIVVLALGCLYLAGNLGRLWGAFVSKNSKKYSQEKGNRDECVGIDITKK